jgi:hypothetical protein
MITDTSLPLFTWLAERNTSPDKRGRGVLISGVVGGRYRTGGSHAKSRNSNKKATIPIRSEVGGRGSKLWDLQARTVRVLRVNGRRIPKTFFEQPVALSRATVLLQQLLELMGPSAGERIAASMPRCEISSCELLPPAGGRRPRLWWPCGLKRQAAGPLPAARPSARPRNGQAAKTANAIPTNEAPARSPNSEPFVLI